MPIVGGIEKAYGRAKEEQKKSKRLMSSFEPVDLSVYNTESFILAGVYSTTDLVFEHHLS
jgi:hypothetical protein